MARVIHMSEADTVLVDIRYPTRSITISDGIIAHTMPIPMRLELLSVPVPAGEVGVSAIMVGISQESWVTASAKMVVNNCSTPNQKMCLGRWGGRDCGRDCTIMYSANSLCDPWLGSVIHSSYGVYSVPERAVSSRCALEL
jgi:hypothetical protein